MGSKKRELELLTALCKTPPPQRNDDLFDDMDEAAVASMARVWNALTPQQIEAIAGIMTAQDFSPGKKVRWWPAHAAIVWVSTYTPLPISHHHFLHLYGFICVCTRTPQTQVMGDEKSSHDFFIVVLKGKLVEAWKISGTALEFVQASGQIVGAEFYFDKDDGAKATADQGNVHFSQAMVPLASQEDVNAAVNAATAAETKDAAVAAATAEAAKSCVLGIVKHSDFNALGRTAPDAFVALCKALGVSSKWTSRRLTAQAIVESVAAASSFPAAGSPALGARRSMTINAAGFSLSSGAATAAAAAGGSGSDVVVTKLELYRELLSIAVSEKKVTPAFEKQVEAFVKQHGVTPAEHAQVLAAMGVSDAEWAEFKENAARAEALKASSDSVVTDMHRTMYKTILTAFIADNEISPVENIELANARDEHMISDELHNELLVELGSSPEAFAQMIEVGR